jgi:spermidine/putrescine transport system substrate-binding protein
MSQKGFKWNSGKSRRDVLKGGAALAGTMALGPSAVPAFAAEEEPVLNAFVLSGYQQSGILEKFEKDTGIKVNLKIGNGHEEMFALIKSSQGQWDVSTVTSAYIQAAAKGGHLMALDESELPLDKYLPPFDKWALNYHDGKLYALLNRFGYYGITYNSDQMSREDWSSYDALFDPKLQGKIALFDWHLPIMGVIGRYLGYEDPYAVDAEGLKAIRAKLFELRPQVGLIGNNAQTIQGLASQSYWVTIAGEWVQAGLKDDGLPYEAVLPKEGGVTWDQSAVILKDAPHPNNARKFLQYLAGAHFQSQFAVADVYYSMVPNVDAITQLSPEHRELLNLQDLDVFRSEFLPNLAPRRFPNDIEAWKEIWAEFKSA